MYCTLYLKEFLVLVFVASVVGFVELVYRDEEVLRDASPVTLTVVDGRRDPLLPVRTKYLWCKNTTVYVLVLNITWALAGNGHLRFIPMQKREIQLEQIKVNNSIFMMLSWRRH